MAMAPAEEADEFLDLLNPALDRLPAEAAIPEEQTRRLVRLMRIAHRILPAEHQVFERMADMLVANDVPIRRVHHGELLPEEGAEVNVDDPGEDPELQQSVSTDVQDDPEPHEPIDVGFDFEPNRIYRSSTITIGHLRLGVGHGYHAEGGRVFYTSESGNTFDTSHPPPFPCRNCPGERLWRSHCPFATGNETIA